MTPFWLNTDVTWRPCAWVPIQLMNSPLETAWVGKHGQDNLTQDKISDILIWRARKIQFWDTCKPNIYVSWSTSEIRVRLAPRGLNSWLLFVMFMFFFFTFSCGILGQVYRFLIFAAFLTLMRRLSLICIDAICQLSSGCLLMRTIKSFLR